MNSSAGLLSLPCLLIALLLPFLSLFLPPLVLFLSLFSYVYFNLTNSICRKNFLGWKPSGWRRVLTLPPLQQRPVGIVALENKLSPPSGSLASFSSASTCTRRTANYFQRCFQTFKMWCYFTPDSPEHPLDLASPGQHAGLWQPQVGIATSKTCFLFAFSQDIIGH